ncbi:MAG TPA: transglycosylase domain-containing protein, partial [Sphingomicrobium sp.]|nr:transglycosylase domain-containing protein [Sphingomicrobium sp.]
MADYDGIWSRNGANVEDLPDPLAPANPPPPPIGEEPQEAPRRSRWRRVKIGFYIFSAVLLLTIVWLIVTAPLSRALEPLPDPAMLFLSEEGQPIARRGAMKEAPVEVAKLDPMTPAAFIAIEDRRFHRHWGIDPRAIGRAFVTNIRAGGVRQGGSTIT